MYIPHAFTLANGLRVVAVERPQSPSFAAVLTYGFGSYSDPSDLPGAAHFSEHLAFRGANREVVERLTDGGGSANARTGADHTQFSASGPLDKLQLALNFFANIMANPPASEVDVAMERQVFRHELAASRRSNPRNSALDRYWRVVLGDPNWRTGHRYQVARIPRLTADRVNEWRQSRYRIAAACLAVVSPMTRDELRTMLDQQLGQIPVDEDVDLAVAVQSQIDRPRVTFSIDRYQYAWIYVTHVIRSTNPLVRLTATIVRRRLHSELFRRLREERALAYGVFANHWEMLSATAVNCHCTVSRRSVSEALDVILQCQREFLTQRVDEAHFAAAKEVLRQRQEVWHDHPGGVAAYLAHESHRPANEDLSDPNRYCQLLSSLNVDEFNDAASSLMASSNRQAFLGGRFGPIARFRLRRQLRNS